jgi:uncharacterized protein (TIGR03437 family)
MRMRKSFVHRHLGMGVIGCLLTTVVPCAAQSLRFSSSRIDWVATAGQVSGLRLPVVVDTPDGSKVPFRFDRAVSQTESPTFVVVSPSRGVTPQTVWIALHPQVTPYLSPATHQASLVFAIEGDSCTTGVCGGSFQVVLRLLPKPAPSVSWVGNAATRQEGSIAPGSIVTILGQDLGPVELPARFDERGLYPTTLGGSRVTFDGEPVGLLYVSPTQINVLAPYAIAGKRTVDVVVSYWERAAPVVTAAVAETAPGIFTASGEGSGPGAFLNHGTTPNHAGNPIRKGYAISLFATGTGAWTEPVPEASAIIRATQPPVAPVTVTIGGQPANILYAGGAPFQPSGVIQVNVVVPEGIGSGAQAVVLTAGGNSSAPQQVTVAVE